MRKYKLIAIDIDGTLLTTDKVLLEETKSNICEAQKNGVVVCICTGRGYPAARRYIDQLNLDIPLILYNGSRIRRSNDSEVVYNQVIDTITAKEVYRLIEEHNGTCCFWKNDTLYFNKNDEYAVYYENLTTIKPNFVNEINDELLTDINKFIWFGKSEWLDKVQSDILVDCRGINYFKSNIELLEIVPPNVNKGQTLKFLCDSLGILPEEVIAIGDEENDLSMIEFAGLGVAMGNAKDIVKQKADYITFTNDENGVGEVIKKFIL